MAYDAIFARLKLVGKIFIIAGLILAAVSASGLLQSVMPRHMPYIQGAYLVLGIFLVVVGTYVWHSTREADEFWLRQAESKSN